MRTRVTVPTDRRAGIARTRGASSARTLRARGAGGPQDRALYRCACGHASVQAVSTTVACPACGSAQDW